jgi:OOP family OmpA-OmpF porin
MRKMHLIAAAITSALCLSAPASAGFFDLTFAPYIGINGGQSTADTCITGTCDKKDTAWKVYGGMEMNEYLSMQVGYVDLGTVDYTAPKGTRETHGVTFQVVGTYSLNPSFMLFATGGMNVLNSEINGAVAGPSGNTGKTDVAWSAGLGAQYNFTKAVGMRAEWERFHKVGGSLINGGTGRTDIDLASIGVVYKF